MMLLGSCGAWFVTYVGATMRSLPPDPDLQHEVQETVFGWSFFPMSTRSPARSQAAA